MGSLPLMGAGPTNANANSCYDTWEDDFNRDNGALGNNWHQFNADGAEDFEIVSNEAVMHDGAALQTTYAINEAEMCSDDNWSQVNTVFTLDANNYAGSIARSQSYENMDNLYFGLVFRSTPEPSPMRIGIVKWVAGVATTLVWVSYAAFDPTSVNFDVTGTTLTVTVQPDDHTDNTTDSDISTGKYVGFVGRTPASGGNDVELDNFVSGT